MTENADYKKLTIIVPAYKVDTYIEKCIRSLEDQDLPKEEYEIIVINDGSPDRCREIVEGLQKEFSNIILINQENQGVSMARNNGINRARGAYIMFVDADDYVSNNTFKHILGKIQDKNLDILYVGFLIINELGQIVWRTNYNILKEQIFNGVEGYFAARGEGIKEPDSSCSKIYRTSLIRKYEISYPQNVPILEDGLFLGKVFSVAERVGFCDELLYYRTIRIGSAMNSKIKYSETEQNGYFNALKDLNAFENSISLNEQSKKLINHIRAKFVVLSMAQAINTFSPYKFFNVVKFLKKIHLEKLDLEGVRFMYFDLIRVYNQSKIFYPFYFKIISRNS